MDPPIFSAINTDAANII